MALTSIVASQTPPSPGTRPSNQPPPTTAPQAPDDPAALAADRAYRAGLGFLNRGMHEQAAAELRAFLEHTPSGPDADTARYALAVCLSQLGRPKDAAAELDRVVAVKGFPFAADAKLLRAHAALQLGEPAAAAALLESIEREHAGFAQLDRAAAMRGEALYRLGKFSEAAKVLARAAERWPQSESRDRAELFAALAELAEGKAKQSAERASARLAEAPKSPLAGRLALAAAQSRHRLGELPAAKAMYERAAAGLEEPARPEALIGLAQVTRALGDAAKAEEILKPMMAGGAGAPTAARLEMGRVLHDRGRFAEALALLDAAARESADETKAGGEKTSPPDDARATAGPAAGDGVRDDAAFWAARCELKLGRADPAAARLKAAIEAFPKSRLRASMLFDRGVALARGGKDDEASAAFAAVRAAFPAHELAPEALAAEAGCAQRLGKPDRAAALAKEFGDRFADHSRAAEMLMLAAVSDEQAGRPDAAERAYRALAERFPKDPRAWSASVRRGLCLMALKRETEAVAVLTTAVEDKSRRGASARPGEPTAAEAALARSAWAALGDSAFAKQDWPAAERWYAELVKAGGDGRPGQEPDDAAAAKDAAGTLLRLGLSVHRQSRAAEALPIFERAQEQTADAESARQAVFERGQALADLGRLDEARAAFERVVSAGSREENPSPNPLPPGGGAGSELDRDRFVVPALRHLAAIASTQGRSAEAAELLGRVASASGAEDAAEAQLQRGRLLLSAAKYADAERVLGEFCEKNPGHARLADARAARAIAVARQGRLEEAVTLFDEAARGLDTPERTKTAAGDGSGRAATDAGLLALAKYESASAKRALGRTADAEREYRAMLMESVPGAIEARVLLELAQIEAGASRFESAAALLERCREAARRLDADDAGAIGERESYLRGLCELRLNKPDRASETLGKFLEDHAAGEMSGSAALLRAEALSATGRPDAAADQLRALLDAGPPAELMPAALLRLGEACTALQRWTEADEVFTRFLAKFASHELWFQARFGQGWARERQGRREAAIEAYRDVAERHKGPTAARAQFQVGECLFTMQKHEDAVRELVKVDVLYAVPEWSAPALYEAGRCLAEMGRTAEAVKQFDEVMKRFPGTKWAESAKAERESARPAALPGREPAKR